MEHFLFFLLIFLLLSALKTAKKKINKKTTDTPFHARSGNEPQTCRKIPSTRYMTQSCNVEICDGAKQSSRSYYTKRSLKGEGCVWGALPPHLKRSRNCISPPFLKLVVSLTSTNWFNTWFMHYFKNVIAFKVKIIYKNMYIYLTQKNF